MGLSGYLTKYRRYQIGEILVNLISVANFVVKSLKSPILATFVGVERSLDISISRNFSRCPNKATKEPSQASELSLQFDTDVSGISS